MARPWRIRYAGAKYHVTVRGNGRRQVFHGERDYLRFLSQLDDALEKDGVVLYAYALLSNHFHLLIETPSGNVQRFMQRLNTAYSMYHRFKHSEPGHCFQGRYGAKLVSGDDYLQALTRYIHLNPVKITRNAQRRKDAVLADLATYPWSSYRGYASGTRREDRVDYRWLGLMGSVSESVNRRRYRQYVESFVMDTDETLQSALHASRYAVGDDRFIERVEAEVTEARVKKALYGDILWPERSPLSLETIADAVAEQFRLAPQALASRCHAARLAKKVALELGCRYSGLSQRQVGEYFGYRGNGSVGKQRDRLRELLAEDQALRRACKKLEKRLADA